MSKRLSPANMRLKNIIHAAWVLESFYQLSRTPWACNRLSQTIIDIVHHLIVSNTSLSTTVFLSSVYVYEYNHAVNILYFRAYDSKSLSIYCFEKKGYTIEFLKMIKFYHQRTQTKQSLFQYHAPYVGDK